MPLRINWTEQADAALLAMRRDGKTWDAVAAMVGVSRNSAIDRGKRLLISGGEADLARYKVPARGVAAPKPPPVDARPPLCAGHPVTWGMLTRGTCIEGAAYPFPVFG